MRFWDFQVGVRQGDDIGYDPKKQLCIKPSGFLVTTSVKIALRYKWTFIVLKSLTVMSTSCHEHLLHNFLCICVLDLVFKWDPVF